jgi:hypothetical protein
VSEIATALTSLEYWIDLDACVCNAEYPIGACLKCDLEQIKSCVENSQTLLACLQHAVEEWKTCHDATLTPPPEHWLEAIKRNEKCQKITDGL